MVNRYSSFAVLLVFLLQACASQIISEHTLKGMLVKEEASGQTVERSRKKTLQLSSPLSVQAGEQVERVEDIRRYYQKLLVSKKARARQYPYLDTYLKFLIGTAVIPLFTYTYWVQGSYAGPDCRKEEQNCVFEEARSVAFRDYVVENGTRSVVEQVPEIPGTGTVTLFINGYYKGELPVDSRGTARVDLLQYPDLLNSKKDVKLTFKYFDSYAYSVIKRIELEKIMQVPAP